METITNDKLEGMLRKVQAMLARADHPNTPPHEADTARNMAEAMMYRYRIDEAMLSTKGGAAEAMLPAWGTFVVCRERSEFARYYRSIAAAALAHLDCRGVYKYVTSYDEQGNPTTNIVCEFVGFDTDRRLAEALFTACMLAFQQRLEPKYDANLSDQENAYNMRNAGMEGWRIAMAIFGKDDKALRPKVRAMFKAEAIKRGEDPSVLLGKGNSVKAYREDYALGFASTINDRLRSMRLSRGQVDTGLVLADRLPRINEVFYERYPEYRPTSGNTGPYRAPNHGCPKCAAAKSGYCREHGWLKPRQVRQGRSTNWTALERGNAAARTVDLGARGENRVETTNVKGEVN